MSKNIEREKRGGNCGCSAWLDGALCKWLDIFPTSATGWNSMPVKAWLWKAPFALVSLPILLVAMYVRKL